MRIAQSGALEKGLADVDIQMLSIWDVIRSNRVVLPGQ